MSPRPHAIMIGFPFQGHITPFLSLAIKLASRGFIITFAHLKFVHHMISQTDPFSQSRDSGLDIRYTTIDDGFPLEFDRVHNRQKYWETMFRDFPGRVEELVVKIIRDSDSHVVPFLIADTLYTWPVTIAQKHNLVNVSFWTEPALVFSLLYHMDLLKQNGHFPCKDHIEEEVNYIPGVDSISTKDLMPYMMESSVGTMAHKIALKAFTAVHKADFILHNTVHELESETIAALNEIQPNYAIGPVNFSNNVVRKSLFDESDCTSWLESKPPDSVLYIAFGSLVDVSDDLIVEIAYGLMLSGVYFIWVVRDGDALPVGFRDEVEDRGLIVPWCNQIKVLGDPAIGGFLTHCGWNSILESMWCGVPMLCYPMMYDQPPNRKLVVEDWKIGINLCDGTKRLDRKQVCEKVKVLIGSGISSERLRKEAKRLKSKLRNGVDGIGDTNLEQFIKDLTAKLSDKQCS